MRQLVDQLLCGLACNCSSECVDGDEVSSNVCHRVGNDSRLDTLGLATAFHLKRTELLLQFKWPVRGINHNLLENDSLRVTNSALVLTWKVLAIVEDGELFSRVSSGRAYHQRLACSQIFTCENNFFCERLDVLADSGWVGTLVTSSTLQVGKDSQFQRILTDWRRRDNVFTGNTKDTDTFNVNFNLTLLIGGCSSRPRSWTL